MSSASSTLHISGLAKDKLRTLRAHAKEAGLTPEKYAKHLIEEAISIERRARTTTIDELFAPVQKQFHESGMTEEELDKLIDSARPKHNRRTPRRKS
jgi:hypothetical protein